MFIETNGQYLTFFGEVEEVTCKEDQNERKFLIKHRDDSVHDIEVSLKKNDSDKYEWKGLPKYVEKEIQKVSQRAYELKP